MAVRLMHWQGLSVRFAEGPKIHSYLFDAYSITSYVSGGELCWLVCEEEVHYGFWFDLIKSIPKCIRM